MTFQKWRNFCITWVGESIEGRRGIRSIQEPAPRASLTAVSIWIKELYNLSNQIWRTSSLIHIKRELENLLVRKKKAINKPGRLERESLLENCKPRYEPGRL